MAALTVTIQRNSVSDHRHQALAITFSDSQGTDESINLGNSQVGIAKKQAEAGFCHKLADVEGLAVSSTWQDLPLHCPSEEHPHSITVALT